MTMQIDAQDFRAMPDVQLERLAADGDKPAFGELYERYSSRVHDFLMRMVRDPDEAADLMQETFVRAMKSLSAERAGGAQFSTFLFTIARNLALTRLDRKKRTVPLSSDDDGDEESIPYQHVDAQRLSNPHDAVEAQELSDLVWRAAKALDPKQYSLLDLHVRQGLESAEIAQVLGVSKGNAYTMLSRLRDQFESAVAGVVMFQRGRRACADLDTMLKENQVTAVSPTARKLIERHTLRCETCQGQRRELVSARAVLGALAIVPLPLLLKNRVAEASWEAAGSSAGGGAGGAAGGGGASSPAHMLGGIARTAVQSFTSGIVQVAIIGAVVVGLAVPGAVLVGPRVFDAVENLRGIGSGSPGGTKLPCAPSQPAALGPASPDPALAAAMFDKANAYRAERGRPALTANPLLDEAAGEYAQFVVQTRWWTSALGAYIHLGADCRDMFDRVTAHGYPNALVGENVMWGSLGVPPDLLFDTLLASPHEDPANIRFSDTGIACFAREAAPPEVSCVQVFAQRPGS
jgi:RNA polymerase sigma factor (sigma-70 family)